MESGVWLLAAQKANKEARVPKRKICFILDAGSHGWGEDRSQSKGRLPTPNNQWAKIGSRNSIFSS